MTEIITYSLNIDIEWATDMAVVANLVYRAFSAQDNRFTRSGNVITVDNKFNMIFATYSSSSYEYSARIDVTPVGDTSNVLQSYWFQYTRGMSGADHPNRWDVKLIRTDNTFHLEMLAYKNSSIINTCGGLFYWYIDDNYENYFGDISSNIGGGSSIPYTSWSIENMTISHIEGNSSSYRIRKLANYKLNNFDLFFAPICVISDVNGSFTNEIDFCSCSNVTYRNTISTNNKNYYAVGTNTLIELPDEES